MRLRLTIILALIFLTLASVSFAEDDGKRIRVGLEYGNITSSHTNLASDTGFEVRSQVGDTSVAILDLAAYKTLKVAPDGWFVLSGDQASLTSTPATSAALAPHHVQVGATLGSPEAMKAELDRLKAIDPEVYPVYENGWRIYYGAYASTGDMNNAVASVALKFGTAAYPVAPNPKRVQVIAEGKLVFLYDSQTEFFLEPKMKDTTDGIMTLNGRTYRGGAGFKRYPDSDLTVINFIPLESYLYGVLPKEMSGSWPLEALKAQAVAARTYTFVKMGKHDNYGFDLCDTTHCQVYGGRGVESPRTNQAVDETAGLLLKYNNALVQAYYHSNSGGHTENIENIWNNPLPYIVGVKDPYSVGSPNTDWSVSYSYGEIESILRSGGHDVGRLQDVRIDKKSQFDRVLELTFVGSSKSVTLIKEETRKLFGYTKIKSMWFDIGDQAMAMAVNDKGYFSLNAGKSYVLGANGQAVLLNQSSVVVSAGSETNTLGSKQTPNQVTFTGHGYGHGLGMSQWGAKKMAEQGFSFEQILTHYYTGTHIE